MKKVEEILHNRTIPDPPEGRGCAVYLLLFVFVIIVLFFSCCEKQSIEPAEKEQQISVKVTTLPATNARGESATLSGKVEIIGDIEWTYGFSYGESSSMMLASTSVRKGTADKFSIRVTNRFYPLRTYYFSAYVNYKHPRTGEIITVLGNTLSFATEF